MHDFFLDERYPAARPGQKKIVMAAWAVDQHRWRRDSAHRFELFQPPVLKRISSMLESLDGVAFAAEATLDPALFRSGKVDSTHDIPSMARPGLI